MSAMQQVTVGTINEQKFLGDKGFIVFIAFLGAFIPLSTDIYLPALPSMVDKLQTTPALINLTIVFFFIFYAAGTLFWGPLSDKYGRKPVLLVGLSIYTAASVLCIFSTNVISLIVFRIFQAIGCGSATAISTAIIKDSFHGEKRARILAIAQTMATTSPIVSPVLGAIILSVTSWRGAFVFLTLIGLVSLIGAMLLQETIGWRFSGSIFFAIKQIKGTLQNKSLVTLLFTFALLNIAFMSFITASSYIYVDGFGVSEKVYSYFFSANAIFLLLGPLAFIQVSKITNYRTIISLGYGVAIFSGLLLLTIGNRGPILFCLSLIPASFFGNMMGPARMNLMIEQVNENIGSASSVISCTFTLFGSIGMFLISTNLINRVTLLGIMYFTAGLVSLILWRIVYNQPYIKRID
jgi:DHA1 family bicyclomycin/chloramphenicol resistance-like MFS transporter